MIDRQRNSRQIDQSGQLARLNPPQPNRVERMVGRVVQVKSAPKSGVYVLVNPVDIGGPETEGQAYTATPTTAITIPVAILRGSPVVGDDLVCKSVVGSGRWVAEKQGSGGKVKGPTTVLDNCFCPTPTTISITTTYNPVPSSYGNNIDCPQPGNIPTNSPFYYYQGVTINYYSSGFPAYVIEIYPNTTGIFASALFTNPDPNAYYSRWWYGFTCYLNSYTWQLHAYTNFAPNAGANYWDQVGMYSWTINNTTSFCDPFLLTGSSLGSGNAGADYSRCGGSATASG